MHQVIKQHFKTAKADRWWFGLTIFNGLLAVIVSIVIGLAIQPKGVQVITHYSSFGIVQFYRSHWYHLWNYVLLSLVIYGAHSMISLKLHQLKRRDLALALLWLTVGLQIMLLIFAKAIIKVASIG